MTHPVLQGMLMTGCLKQQNVLMAFHTYIELCEVKLLWDVDYGYENELDIIYIKAKLKKNSENFDYYIPVSSSSTITPSWIKKVQNKISPNSLFTLVIKDSDSSSVYYNVSSGLIPPLSPEASKKRKCIEEKQRYMWTELKRRKTQLFSEAKSASIAERASASDSVAAELTQTVDDDDDEDDDVIINDVISSNADASSCDNSVNLISEPSNEAIEVIELF